MSAEHERLREAREEGAPWRKWGPYLSERRWGGGRADNVADGEEGAVTHELAPYCAYESGEEGIAGICDEGMHLCFAIALWNGCDPMLKERLFGIPGLDETHAEDVKECYFYLDNVPTHSWMQMLYKYPQRGFPYADLNASARGSRQTGRGLVDTGIFAENRYFDVFVEYAKATPENILIRISIENRGPEAACLHVLPHLWFRNTWRRTSPRKRPLIQKGAKNGELDILSAHHPELGSYSLQCEGAERLLFTDNETNTQRLYNRPNSLPWVKDGIEDYLLNANERSVNPRGQGTRAAAHYRLVIPAGGSRRVRMRLAAEPLANENAFTQFDAIFALRRREADDFYAALKPAGADANLSRIQRLAFSGLLWSKQACPYEILTYVHERRAGAHTGRSTHNSICRRVTGSDVIAAPYKWAHPGFNARDQIFHTFALTFVDPDFAADQLELLLRERSEHFDAQIPPYEWRCNDVDPPVLAWTSLLTYRLLRPRNADRAAETLRLAFSKLLLRFPWWARGSGECGLSEAGRSALYAQNMLEMAIELALLDPGYEKFAIRFFEQFVRIAAAVECSSDQGDELSDEPDGFLHALQSSDGWDASFPAGTLTGFIPLCAVTVFSEAVLSRLPRFGDCVRRHVRRRSGLFRSVMSAQCGRRVLSILDDRRLRRVLAKLLDERAFLSDYGIRTLVHHHHEAAVLRVASNAGRAAGRSCASSAIRFGARSDRRGFILFPVNMLLIRALLQWHGYFGESFRVECPTGSGRMMNLFEVSAEIARRLTTLFWRESRSRMASPGETGQFQNDPHWRDLVLFYQYFDGDDGRGAGASHHMGWTGLVAPLTGLCCGRAADEVIEDFGIAFQRLAPRGERRADPEQAFIANVDERAGPMPVAAPSAEPEKSFSTGLPGFQQR